MFVKGGQSPPPSCIMVQSRLLEEVSLLHRYGGPKNLKQEVDTENNLF